MLIFHANPVWPAMFLLRNKLTVLWSSLVHNYWSFSCCFYDSLFVFNLWHFNSDVSWSGTLWIHLVWNSVQFMTWVSFFFTRWGKFLVIMSSYKFSISCSLISFLYPYDVDIVKLHVVWNSLILFSFLGHFPLYPPFLMPWFCVFCCLIFQNADSVLCFIQPIVLCISEIMFFISDWFSFMISTRGRNHGAGRFHMLSVTAMAVCLELQSNP